MIIFYHYYKKEIWFDDPPKIAGCQTTSDHTTVCSVPEENRCINVLKLNEQAEQFLNGEVEK